LAASLRPSVAVSSTVLTWPSAVRSTTRT